VDPGGYGGGEKSNRSLPPSHGFTRDSARQLARQLNYPRGNAIMKTTKIAVLVLTIAVALFILIPSL
jgi:hypothetical protein